MLPESPSLLELATAVPDEAAARRFFENTRWPDGPRCPSCDVVKVQKVPNARPMPYRCRVCRRYFSVRTMTVMERSKLPLRKWLFAMYLVVTRPKGISSVQLAKDIGVTQKTAWYLLARIRRAWEDEGDVILGGVAEADETYVGGKKKNMHLGRRRQYGKGAAPKMAVVGIRERGGPIVARVMDTRWGSWGMGRYFSARVKPDTKVYTDSSLLYSDLTRRGFQHGTSNHHRGQYQRGPVYTNGIESLWAVLKRSYIGTYHWMSPKHLPRYLAEFVGRHNTKHLPPMARVRRLVEAWSTGGFPICETDTGSRTAGLGSMVPER